MKMRGAAASLLAFAALAPRCAWAHCRLQYQVIGAAGLFYDANIGGIDNLGLLPGGTTGQLGAVVSWSDTRALDLSGTIQVVVTATDLTGSVTCPAVSLPLDGPPACGTDNPPEVFPVCTPSFTVTQTAPHVFACSSSCVSYPQPHVSPVYYTPPNSPAPPVSTLSFNSTTAGAPPLAVGVQGSGFVGSSQVQWNGSALPTVLVDNSDLLALIPPSLTTYPGSNSVTVLNPGGASSPLAFVTQPSSVTAAPRTIVSLSFDMGTGDQLLARQILEAHGFRGTFYINSGTIGTSSYYLSVSDLQSMQAAGHQIAGQTVDHVDLTTMTPTQLQHQVCDDRTTILGWGLNDVDFNYPYGHYNSTVTATVQSCGYRSARTLYGIGPLNGLDCGSSCVYAESVPPANMYAIRTPILFSSSAVAGDFEAVVASAEQNGGGWVPFVMHHVCEGCASNSISTGTLTAFTDWLASRASLGTGVETVGHVLDGNMPPNPVPSLSGLSPALAAVGASTFTLTVNGANFTETSFVRCNGTYRQTVFISTTQLTAVISASDVAASTVAQVAVFTPGPGGGVSSAGAFTVAPLVPSITSMSPVSALTGSSGLTLTINGMNFVSSSIVLWNGAALQTVVVSSAQLTALIPSSDLTAPATAQVTALNPGSGGGMSSAVVFTVGRLVPSISNMSPTSTMAGSADVRLTINGTNFVSSSTVLWSGSALQTVIVSSTQLTAVIPASDLAAPATAQITVSNPGSGGGASAAQAFLVMPSLTVVSTTVAVGSSGGMVTLMAPAGPITLLIPPGAFASAVAMTVIAPTSLPGGVGPAAILTGTGVGVQFVLNPAVEPLVNAALSISYRTSDVAGMDPRTLLLAWYDPAQNVWVPMVSSVDALKGTVTAKIDHFSTFQIMQAAPSSTVSTAKAFPNPLRPSQGQNFLTFSSLPASARIRIYSQKGAVIKDLTANASGMANWDGTNQSGSAVASGVYFVFAQGAGQSRTLEVGVQR